MVLRAACDPWVLPEKKKTKYTTFRHSHIKAKFWKTFDELTASQPL
jgi:hypothetical protein